MRVLVVGAGAQGGPCASILSRDSDVSEIILGDVNLNLAKRVADRIGSEKVVPKRVDASSLDSLVEAASGVDAVINLTPPRFNLNVMRAALKCGAHYVDTASGPDLDLHPIDYMVGKQLEMDEEWKKAGLTALISCGATPGLTNVLARYLCDELERVYEVRFRVGEAPVRKEKVVKTWNPGWSPEVALLYRSSPAVVFEDGGYKRYPPCSGVEEYVFPEPVGRCTLALVDHEECVTIPRFIGKGIRYVDYKNVVDEIAVVLGNMGFASNEPVEVGGVKVVPRDVLLKLVKPPVNEFLTESEETIRSRPLDYVYCTVITVRGEDEEGSVECRLIRGPHVPSVEERLELFRRFGTELIGVALPAVVGAKMCVEGRSKSGVIAPECLDPREFLGRMARAGAPVKFRKIVIRETLIE